MLKVLLLSLFLLIPFQRRLHGFFDSLSRKLTLPDFPLPEFFSRKIHLFASDLLIIVLALLVLFHFKASLRAFFWEGPAKYLTLLFFVFLLSTSISVSKTYSLQYFRLFQFSLIFLFFNALCFVRQRIDLAHLIHRLAWLIVCVSLFECAVGIAQYFSQSSIGLKFLGEGNPKHFLFFNQSGQQWLFGTQPTSPYIYRVCGTFLHPNIFGGFLFCSLMASYYLCIQAAEKSKRLFLFAVIILQFFALYLSFSRSAILALVFATVVWCFLQFKQAFAFRKLIFVATTVCCGALVGIVLLYPQLKAKGGIINYNAASQGTDSERVVYMKVATAMIQEHPLLGVGYNNFQLHVPRHQPRFPNYLYSKVHNIYLLIAAESGLIGGGLFLLFLLTLLRTAWRGFSQSEAFQEKAFLFSTFAGLLLIGACDFYLLASPHGSLPFFGIAGLLYGINARAENRICQPSQTS